MSETIQKYLPKYKVNESETELTLQVALPEVKKEDISLTVEGTQLKLYAKRDVTEQVDWSLISQHQKPTEYSLKLRVKADFDLKQAEAKYENNILKLSVPSASDSAKEIIIQ